jgi:4'-phosphopantetheinyl transferase
MRQDNSNQLRPDIDIYYFSLDVSSSERTRLFQFLDESERQRAARYRFDKHRHRFICGRGSIREILAGRAKCQPQSIRFEVNEFGKPSIHEPGFSSHIQFNASSSEMLGAIAISTSHSLGFDIEQIKPDKGQEFELIVKNEFTSDEYKWYEKQTFAKRDKAFYTLWTCKEAYLKALGIGLNGGLNSFSIDLSGDRAVVKYTNLESSQESSLFLYPVDTDEEVAACLAVAAENCQIQICRW